MELSDPRPGKWQLFRIWASIGLQSFGGGASTTFLIQHAFIDKYKWMTMEEFLHMWNLCILTPGINLVALTVLIGKKLGGMAGVAASLAGLLLPSATITCLLAAVFEQIESIPTVQIVIRGVVPATAGVMALVAINFTRPLIEKSTKEGWLFLLTSAILVAVCAFAVIFLKVSVIIVILGSAIIGALFFSPRRPASTSLIKEEQEVQR
jgi:chromate transporter